MPKPLSSKLTLLTYAGGALVGNAPALNAILGAAGVPIGVPSV